MRVGWAWLKEGKRLWLVICGAVFVVALFLSSTSGKSGVGSASGSAEERRIAEVLSAMAGAGHVEVALFYETEAVVAFGGSAKTRPTGAVVVAQGARDMQVRLSLSRAVRTLLGLPENAVDVFIMEEER